MSTSANSPLTSGSPFPIARDMRVAVVRTLWNSHITEALMNGALDTFAAAGIEKTDIDTSEVPGAVELTHLNADCDIPVIFGVLTVDNEEQALDRAGGRLGNKGSEAAQTAMLMFDFKEKVAKL